MTGRSLLPDDRRRTDSTLARDLMLGALAGVDEPSLTQATLAQGVADLLRAAIELRRWSPDDVESRADLLLDAAKLIGAMRMLSAESPTNIADYLENSSHGA